MMGQTLSTWLVSADIQICIDGTQLTIKLDSEGRKAERAKSLAQVKRIKIVGDTDGDLQAWIGQLSREQHAEIELIVA